MGRDEHAGVGREQCRSGQVVDVAGRRVRDGRVFGLALIKHGERATTAPPAQNNRLVAQPLAGSGKDLGKRRNDRLASCFLKEVWR